METPTRRDVLKGVGAAAGSIALGPKLVSAEPASSRYIVDVGDRASTIDTDRVENAGLTVIHDLEEIGYLVVEGAETSLSQLDYQWVPDVELQVEFPEKAVKATDEDLEGVEQGTDSPEAFGSYSPPAYWALQWDKDRHRLPAALESADGSGTQIAIIDTGVTAAHPDLTVSPDVSNGGLSKNFTGDGMGSGIPYGGYHGTHVGGIVGANGNNAIGTAPGTELVDCRVFGTTPFANTGDITAAIYHAADVGADAANLSLGALLDMHKYSLSDPAIQQYIQMYQDAMNYAHQNGTFVAVAAGNDSTDLDSRYLSMPAEVGNVATVSATGPIGYLWGTSGVEDPPTTPAIYTNTGGTVIDIAAAGGDYDPQAAAEDTKPWYNDLVFNTIAEYDYENDEVDSESIGYGWAAGTSMAAPQVAGAAALVRDQYPDASAEQIFDMLVVSSETGSASGYTRETHGNGFLNLANLMDAEPGDAPTGSGRSGNSGRGGRSGRGPGRGDNYGDDTTGSGRGGRSGRG